MDMDRKSLLLILASCTAAVPVAAPALDMSEPTHSLVEFGVGYVTDDAYRFGRYSGLEDEGAYLLGDITAHRYGEEGGFWQARGTNLGLDSRYLRLDFGYQGRHEYFLEYDELPNNFSDTVSTPYVNAGDSTLKLDEGLRLTPFEIETRRERIGLGARLFTRKHWLFDVAYHHETREGTGKSGSARAYDDLQGLVGNTNAALLPEPVDYQTDRVNVSLQYAKEQLQFELAYHLSLFDNDDRSLTWEDYFNPDDPDSNGSLALAPDNEFHQVTATLGYQLPHNTHVTGVLSSGLMTQDQDFQPYSVAGGMPPRSDLDGEVWLTTAQLKLASRPLPKLRLSAGYTYNERDNDSSVESYDNVVIADGVSRNNPVENRPLSYERNRLDLTANYRINSGMSLRGGYSYDDMSRDYADAEREDTDENTLFAKWKLRPHDDVNLALYAEASERDGSNYRAPADENPAMRKYYLADRDRTKLGALIDYMATDNLSLSLSADYIEDDYENSEIGLTEATQPTYTLDVSYQPARDVTTHAYYTREDIESTQYGSETDPDEERDWKAEFDDTIDTFGIGAQIAEIRGKWDVGADLTWSKATGDADLTDLSDPGTEGQYPDLETELTRLKLWALYRYRHNLSFKLSYWYEDYDADNWSYDGLTATSGVNNNLLLLGEETQDYDTSVIAASVIYHFD
jgi:MtrB/PioB family decaheme-associated outer membrane protein